MSEREYELAGIRPPGGITKDGQFIIFRFDTLEDETLQLSCPAEAVSEIVNLLLSLAEWARETRGEPDNPEVPPGTEMKANARELTGFRTAVSKDGAKIVLTCETGPILKQELSMPPHVSKQLGEMLLRSHEEWLKRFPPN